MGTTGTWFWWLVDLKVVFQKLPLGTNDWTRGPKMSKFFWRKKRQNQYSKPSCNTSPSSWHKSFSSVCTLVRFLHDRPDLIWFFIQFFIHLYYIKPLPSWDTEQHDLLVNQVFTSCHVSKRILKQGCSN